MIIDVVKVFLPSTIAFCVGIFLTPFLTHYLYKYKMWKKKAGKISADGKATVIFNELHKHKEVGTPRMGGIIIWGSAFLTISVIWLLAHFEGGELIHKLDFLSRSQTWVPLSTLIFGALVGLVDDYLEIKGSGGHIAGGLSLSKRLIIVAFMALLCALWFYIKLDVSSLGLPFGRSLEIGWLFIPLFILVTIALYSGGVIDGIDGLAGLSFLSLFRRWGAERSAAGEWEFILEK